MRKSLYVLAAVALLPFVAAGDDATKKELDRFRGTWKFESVEIEGQAVPADGIKDVRLILDGDKFTMEGGGLGMYKGTFKVDVSKKPKTIDVTFTEGPEKGKTSIGIYTLEGDTYKVCMDPQGKERPTKFESKKGSPFVLEVLKREKK
jgi:uncharacterized protein (TIGR03067 family)